MYSHVHGTIEISEKGSVHKRMDDLTQKPLLY